jgi:hypothetical protein
MYLILIKFKYLKYLKMEEEKSIDNDLNSLDNKLSNLNIGNLENCIEKLEDKINEDIEIIDKANSLLKKVKVNRKKERNKKNKIYIP